MKERTPLATARIRWVRLIALVAAVTYIVTTTADRVPLSHRFRLMIIPQIATDTVGDMTSLAMIRRQKSSFALLCLLDEYQVIRRLHWNVMQHTASQSGQMHVTDRELAALQRCMTLVKEEHMGPEGSDLAIRRMVRRLVNETESTLIQAIKEEYDAAAKGGGEAGEEGHQARQDNPHRANSHAVHLVQNDGSEVTGLFSGWWSKNEQKDSGQDSREGAAKSAAKQAVSAEILEQYANYLRQSIKYQHDKLQLLEQGQQIDDIDDIDDLPAGANASSLFSRHSIAKAFGSSPSESTQFDPLPMMESGAS